MTSCLIVEPYISIFENDKTDDNEKNELQIERKIIMNMVLNRVEEETGTRPELREDPKNHNKHISEEACKNLEHLHRYACYLDLHGKPPMISGAEQPDDASRVIKLFRSNYLEGKVSQHFTHLLLPSCPNGYYLPFDFHAPIIITEDMYLSCLREQIEDFSYNVSRRRETTIVASPFRLLSDLDKIDEILNALRNNIKEDEPFYEEKKALQELYELATFAIEKNQAILWKEKAYSC